MIDLAESVRRRHICPNMTNSSWQTLLEMPEDLQMTLDLIYTVLYGMLFNIQSAWVKACYEDYVFALSWILTLDTVSFLRGSVCT